MMKKAALYKNKILLLTYVITLIPKTVFGLDIRFNLGLFVERSTRIDFFLMYYTNAISFLILAYCFHYSKGIDKRVTRLLLTLTSLDLLHLITIAKQGYVVEKIALAIIIVVGYEKYKQYATT